MMKGKNWSIYMNTSIGGFIGRWLKSQKGLLANPLLLLAVGYFVGERIDPYIGAGIFSEAIEKVLQGKLTSGAIGEGEEEDFLPDEDVEALPDLSLGEAEDNKEELLEQVSLG
jgi:hypothetical protein